MASSSKPFAGAESGSPGRALEAGKRGSPGRAVQAGIRGKRLKDDMKTNKIRPEWASDREGWFKMMTNVNSTQETTER